MQFLTDEKGFTLIETIVALFVFTVGILALNQMQVMSIYSNSDASGLTGASSWAAGQVENILRLDYDDPLLADDGDGVNPAGAGDGTGEDTVPNDGIDDDGGDFGLNNITAISADGFLASPDGNFMIYWNVAVDEPMRNIKTIRITVVRNSAFALLQRNVSFEYQKINTF